MARLTAGANKTATVIRGEAEARAAEVYASAHGADPEFASWLLELKSLPSILGAETTLILRTDASPFHLLEDKGAKPTRQMEDQDRDG